MKKQNYNVVGVMSGTSLDGIDLAHIHFNIQDNIWHFELLECETIPYSEVWVQTLKAAVDFEEKDLVRLNIEYTKVLANIISSFIEKYALTNLDAVCSHGHTILHQPQKGITLQIGNLPELAKLIQQRVICNFRVQDVLLGGQGAPLVPIGDRILFSSFDFCLNLGGFSNVSMELEGKRIAFDISPVNTVLNYYANLLHLPYDDQGNIARNAKVSDSLLAELDALEFYVMPFPKSLGIEFVKSTIFPIIEKYNLPIPEVLATFNWHIANQIAKALPVKNGKLLVTGGGAYNLFLLERIKSQLPYIELIIPEAKTLEFKEALIFGLLGVLRWRNDINVLASVTGAKTDHCSGEIWEM